MHLAELAMEAGLPNGVLNVIHGTNVSFQFIFVILLLISLFPSQLFKDDLVVWILP